MEFLAVDSQYLIHFWDIFWDTINEKWLTDTCKPLLCGERGIRTPGPVKVNGFQDRRIRPLCHLSSDVPELGFVPFSHTSLS